MQQHTIADQIIAVDGQSIQGKSLTQVELLNM
jgi:hypothetical protein